MGKESAGLLIYRLRDNKPEVFLVHPGGPFWKNKDTGAWSIPKGEFTAPEDALAAAVREVKEETGFNASGPFYPLNPVKLKSGKKVYAWACKQNPDPAQLISNQCKIEWPPRSGKFIEIPEVDKADWFSLEEAVTRINGFQIPFIEELKNVII